MAIELEAGKVYLDDYGSKVLITSVGKGMFSCKGHHGGVYMHDGSVSSDGSVQGDLVREYLEWNHGELVFHGVLLDGCPFMIDYESDNPGVFNLCVWESRERKEQVNVKLDAVQLTQVLGRELHCIY